MGKSERVEELVSPGFRHQSKVTDWSVEPEQFGKFLITIFDEWVRNDVGSYFVQLFDVKNKKRNPFSIISLAR